MIIIGVMGGGSASPKTLEQARELGRLIAREGWVLLNGGRAAGVMDASAQGAREAGGLTVGVLPDGDRSQTSQYVDVAILTDMGAARNCINVLSSQVVVACPGGAGTLSEAALAFKSQRPVVFLGWNPGPAVLGMARPGTTALCATPEEAMAAVKTFLQNC